MIWFCERAECGPALAAYERAQRLGAMSAAELSAELGVDAGDLLGSGSIASSPEVIDGVAHIEVRGILLETPNPIMEFFGVEHSSYAEISAQVIAADNDPAVDSIVLDIDSPGGLESGMFKAGDIIGEASKDVTARSHGMVASAAYLLASRADTIEATARNDKFGSIGAAVDMYVDPSVVGIASTDAPDKRPDVTTEEGKEQVRSLLNQAHDLFAADVAAGRSVTREHVNEEFGRGGLLLADRALAAGMIDAVSPEEPAMPTPENQVTGVRAALGLNANASHEDIIREALNIKAKAAESEALVAKLEQADALVEASKTQLAKAKAHAEALEAKDAERSSEVFAAKRDAVINEALEANKIVPAQVEQLTAIASDEKGLESLVDLLAVTASMGLTTASPAITSPKGATTAMSPEEYAATYNCSPELAAKLLAKRGE